VTLHPNHRLAIANLLDTFGDARVSVVEPGDGGAIVTITGLDVGESWTPSVIALTLSLPVTFPTTAVYPYYVTNGLARSDGGAVPNMTANVVVAGTAYTQVSLTSSPLRSGEWLSERVLSAISWFRSL
jgi:hypothetical protein